MFTIAISRGSSDAALELAEGIKENSGGAIVTREEVIRAAGKYGLQETGLREEHILKQQVPGFWERYADARRHYLACFKISLLDFVLQGSTIYLGNLAHILLDDIPFVLRVRVNAPLENRVSMLSEKRGLAEADAMELIKGIDQQRKRWVQFLYDVDTRDPVLFDIVLNLQRIAIGGAIELVTTEVGKEQFRSTESGIRTVRNLRLASVTEVALMNSPDTYGLDFRVRADESTGEVVISRDPALKESAKSEDIIRAALEGVKEIQNIKIEGSPN